MTEYIYFSVEQPIFSTVNEDLTHFSEFTTGEYNWINYVFGTTDNLKDPEKTVKTTSYKTIDIFMTEYTYFSV